MPSSASIEAYRKAAQRLSPRLSAAALARIGDEIEMAATGAPPSAFSIPASPRHNPEVLPTKHGAAIRSIGTTRRVFLLRPSLSPAEIDGLAFRVRALANNDAINSIVFANPTNNGDEEEGDEYGNPTCLPSFSRAEELRGIGGGDDDGLLGQMENSSMVHLLDPEGADAVPYVSSGYDARQIHGMGLDPARLERELMRPLAALALAVRGDDENSKVPAISVPHGLVTDAGYSLLLGSYVLATHSSSFRILNPLRGLAFDPVGLSYLLPRLGWEFHQPCAPHSIGCALLLALAGYEATAEDMVATGLATHFVGGSYKLDMLERALSQLNSHSNQTLFRPRKTMYGREDEPRVDPNEQFKNLTVGNIIHCLSEYDVANTHEYGSTMTSDLDQDQIHLKDDDPSLTLPEDRVQMYEFVDSHLVNLAATFRSIWEEPSVEGIMERLREVAATQSQSKDGHEQDVEVAQMAHTILSNMELRSPLALCVMHRLLLLGSQHDQTIHSCMEREIQSQMKLMTETNGDFDRWGHSGAGVGLVEGRGSDIPKEEGVFGDWKYASVKDVPEDEIKEIVGV